jgi:hypothetical protein
MRLKSFYAERARRESSERDLGLAWLAADGRSFRAAWIEDTEEVYVVAHLTDDGRGGEVELLGTISEPDLDGALPGWEQICGTERSYEWLAARVEAATTASPRTRPRRQRRARQAVANLLVGRRPALGN